MSIAVAEQIEGAISLFSALNMGGVSESAAVPLSLVVQRGFKTCDGEGVVVGVRDSTSRSGGVFSRGSSSGQGVGGAGAVAVAVAVAKGSARGALASLLREREAEGHRDRVVVLELHGAGDLHWVTEAISWLSGHGRRAIVRTSRVLPRIVVEAARESGASVVLRIASFDPAVQRALLGANADTAARLLLGAQHLEAQHVPTSVLVAPLLPLVHGDAALDRITRHIAAADLRDVSFAVGGWSAARHRALAPHLPSGIGRALARAFRVADPEVAVGRRQLGVREATLLQRQAERIAEAAGLTTPSVHATRGCGCEARCDRSTAQAEPFRSLLAANLFGALAG